MLTNIDKTCNGCMACSNVCPVNCIQMETDKEGFWYPTIQIEQCIDCNRCNEVCPLGKERKADTVQVAYAAINQDEQTRLHSSSGGVFPELAKVVIENGGVVIGPDFDEQWDLRHVEIENQEHIKRLCGSKYVQSKIGESYKAVKKNLADGRIVLFTGTPCQIAGLKGYLGKDYEQLICQDIACHGVASPKVLKEYLAFREKKAHAKVRKMSFRHKVYGWQAFSMLLEYDNEKKYVGCNAEDLYLRMFINDFSLRPSCYACHFKGIDRLADITLADYWGVWNIEQGMDDDLGTSLVIVHSEKGQQLWNAVKHLFRWKLTDMQKAAEYNSALLHSVAKPEKREAFFNDIDATGFTYAIEKYQHISKLRMMKRMFTIKKTKRIKL